MLQKKAIDRKTGEVGRYEKALFAGAHPR